MIKFKIIFGDDGYQQGKDFRHKILHDEMNFSDIYENVDKNAYHIVGRENDEVMCYARLYRTGDYVFCIDKIAVKKEDRMQYVGDTLIRALEDKAVCEIGALIVTTVPENAWAFFEHEDYLPVGEIFTDNSINYKTMKRDLTKVRGCRGGKCQ